MKLKFRRFKKRRGTEIYAPLVYVRYPGGKEEEVVSTFEDRQEEGTIGALIKLIAFILLIIGLGTASFLLPKDPRPRNEFRSYSQAYPQECKNVLGCVPTRYAQK